MKEGDQLRLTLQEASIEYTFYQVEEYNNKFVVRETDASFAPPLDVNNKVVSIPIGNYSLTNLMAQLKLSLNTLPSFFTYEVEYVPQTNTLKFFAVAPNPFDPLDQCEFIFDNALAHQLTGVTIAESMAELIGFEPGTIVPLLQASPPLVQTWTCESPSPITMQAGVKNLIGPSPSRSTWYASTTAAASRTC